MNKIYKLKFSHHRQQLIVVSELAAGAGKTKTAGDSFVSPAPHPLSLLQRLTGKLTPLALGLSLAALLPAISHAADLPSGGQIVGGAGQISTSGNQMTISQQSQNMAATWQSFDIGQNHSVQFVQPDSSAIALNKVTGQSASQIMGQLNANGKVFLINPNGVMVGKGAQVNTAGFLASTKNLSVSDFMQGNYRLNGGSAANAEIVNQGSLTTSKGGFIVLAADKVRNEGTINTAGGKTVLAAADQVTLTLDNSGLTGISVNGNVVNALVENKGLISAKDGKVYLTARGQDMLVKTVVNNTGVIDASSMSAENGAIRLGGGDNSTTSVLANSTNGNNSVPATASLPAPATHSSEIRPDGGNSGIVSQSGSVPANNASATTSTTANSNTARSHTSNTASVLANSTNTSSAVNATTQPANAAADSASNIASKPAISVSSTPATATLPAPAAYSGEIHLDGGSSGVVSQSGTVLASNTGGAGGSIIIEGQNIHLANGSRTSATGTSAGGQVLTGGGWQGKDSRINNAENLVMDHNAVIDVSATQQGNGGTAVLWSEHYTRFHGSITARGGAAGGNGGSVETSSRGNLQAFGNVDTSAPQGNGGNWLLDPLDVTIVSGDTNTSITTASPFTPAAEGAQIGADILNTALNKGGNVVVQTSGTAQANSAKQPGDITVNSSISKTTSTSASLTLQADNNIHFASGVNIDSATGALNLKLLAGNSASISLSEGNRFTLNGGNFSAAPRNSTAANQLTFNSGNQGHISARDITLNTAIATLNTLQLEAANNLTVSNAVITDSTLTAVANISLNGDNAALSGTSGGAGSRLHAGKDLTINITQTASAAGDNALLIKDNVTLTAGNRVTLKAKTSGTSTAINLDGITLANATISGTTTGSAANTVLLNNVSIENAKITGDAEQGTGVQFTGTNTLTNVQTAATTYSGTALISRGTLNLKDNSAGHSTISGEVKFEGYAQKRWYHDAPFPSLEERLIIEKYGPEQDSLNRWWRDYSIYDLFGSLGFDKRGTGNAILLQGAVTGAGPASTISGAAYNNGYGIKFDGVTVSNAAVQGIGWLNVGVEFAGENRLTTTPVIGRIYDTSNYWSDDPGSIDGAGVRTDAGSVLIADGASSPIIGQVFSPEQGADDVYDSAGVAARISGELTGVNLLTGELISDSLWKGIDFLQSTPGSSGIVLTQAKLHNTELTAHVGGRDPDPTYMKGDFSSTDGENITVGLLVTGGESTMDSTSVINTFAYGYGYPAYSPGTGFMLASDSTLTMEQGAQVHAQVPSLGVPYPGNKDFHETLALNSIAARLNGKLQGGALTADSVDGDAIAIKGATLSNVSLQATKTNTGTNSYNKNNFNNNAIHFYADAERPATITNSTIVGTLTGVDQANPSIVAIAIAGTLNSDTDTSILGKATTKNGTGVSITGKLEGTGNINGYSSTADGVNISSTVELIKNFTITGTSDSDSPDSSGIHLPDLITLQNSQLTGTHNGAGTGVSSDGKTTLITSLISGESQQHSAVHIGGDLIMQTGESATKSTITATSHGGDQAALHILGNILGDDDGKNNCPTCASELLPDSPAYHKLIAKTTDSNSNTAMLLDGEQIQGVHAFAQAATGFDIVLTSPSLLENAVFFSSDPHATGEEKIHFAADPSKTQRNNSLLLGRSNMEPEGPSCEYIDDISVPADDSSTFTDDSSTATGDSSTFSDIHNKDEADNTSSTNPDDSTSAGIDLNRDAGDSNISTDTNNTDSGTLVNITDITPPLAPDRDKKDNDNPITEVNLPITAENLPPAWSPLPLILPEPEPTASTDDTPSLAWKNYLQAVLENSNGDFGIISKKWQDKSFEEENNTAELRICHSSNEPYYSIYMDSKKPIWHILYEK